MSVEFADWLEALAKDGGKGVVGNIDARCLGRVAALLRKQFADNERLRGANAKMIKEAETFEEWERVWTDKNENLQTENERLRALLKQHHMYRISPEYLAGELGQHTERALDGEKG